MDVPDAYPEVFSEINRVLVVLAHPDDMEINCGGLMARLVADGKAVRLVVTTHGGKGTKDKVGLQEAGFGRLRVQEQLAAGKILGIPKSENFNLQIPDGEIEPTVENIGQIVWHIRQFRPDLVITHNPEDYVINFLGRSTWVNHRDHRHTGQISLDAVYPYSRDRGFFPQHFGSDGLAPHTVNKVLLGDSYTKPTVKYFAIDDFVAQKKAALEQHVSVFNPQDADDYLSENKFGDHHFEPLAYYKVY